MSRFVPAWYVTYSGHCAVMIVHNRFFSSAVAGRARTGITFPKLGSSHRGGRAGFVPPRILGRATFRGDNQIVVAVAPVDQRELFRIARFPSDRVQHQTTSVVPIVANLTAGRLVPTDVRVSNKL